MSFGVDEIIVDDAWMPEAEPILDIMVDLGFEGTELGPPGYLGTAGQVKERLSSRGLQLVGSFLPQRFTRDDVLAAGLSAHQSAGLRAAQVAALDADRLTFIR